MARRPENVHVYQYRLNMRNEYEFAIFQRADDPKCWQGVSGGVEDGETIEQAALRESFEEAGTPLDATIYRLDTVSYLPSDIFFDRELWGRDVVVCPLFFFAMPFDGEIILSDEHTEVRWLPYNEAERLVYYHEQKTALWELKERLIRGNLIRSTKS
ncbi:MAG: NUDIX pyrophosphatase [Clostridiales bacterium]|nr:NUDIX pyrophosphatase [Clostridiales bacterium]